MNTRAIFSGIISLSLAFHTVRAADDVPTPAAKPVSTVKARAVSELRGQDNAFALMMESYRQLQVLMIKSDYDKRVELAKTITNSTERDRVLLLAQQERDQRITKLQQNLKGFDSAYDTSRKDQQAKTGGEMVTKVTPAEASEQLRHYRVFTPKDFRMENQPSALQPAGARMLYDDKRY